MFIVIGAIVLVTGSRIDLSFGRAELDSFRYLPLRLSYNLPFFFAAFLVCRPTTPMSSGRYSY